MWNSVSCFSFGFFSHSKEECAVLLHVGHPQRRHPPVLRHPLLGMSPVTIDTPLTHFRAPPRNTQQNQAPRQQQPNGAKPGTAAPAPGGMLRSTFPVSIITNVTFTTITPSTTSSHCNLLLLILSSCCSHHSSSLHLYFPPVLPVYHLSLLTRLVHVLLGGMMGNIASMAAGSFIGHVVADKFLGGSEQQGGYVEGGEMAGVGAERVRSTATTSHYHLLPFPFPACLSFPHFCFYHLSSINDLLLSLSL